MTIFIQTERSVVAMEHCDNTPAGQRPSPITPTPLVMHPAGLSKRQLPRSCAIDTNANASYRAGHTATAGPSRRRISGNCERACEAEPPDNALPPSRRSRAESFNSLLNTSQISQLPGSQRLGKAATMTIVAKPMRWQDSNSTLVKPSQEPQHSCMHQIIIAATTSSTTAGSAGPA